MNDRDMHGLQSMLWSDNSNKHFPDAKDSWKFFNFCVHVLGMEMTNIKNKWKDAEKKHANAIKKFTKYVDVNEKDGVLYDDRKRNRTPVMPKSGILYMLSQEGLWPSTQRNRQAARILAQFIAEDASNVANVGAEAASSAPMQQSNAIEQERAHGKALAQEPVLNEPPPSDLDWSNNDEDAPLHGVRNRKLLSDEDLQLWKKQLELQHKQNTADKETSDTYIEKMHKEKFPDKWGELAFQEKQAKIRERMLDIKEKEKLQKEAESKDQPPPAAGPSGEECMGTEVRQQAGPTLPAEEKGAAASAAPTPAKDNARPAAKRKRKPSSCAKDKSAPAGEGGTNSIRRYLVTISEE